MTLTIIPQPQQIQELSSAFTLDQNTQIRADEPALSAAWHFSDLLARATGLRLPVTPHRPQEVENSAPQQATNTLTWVSAPVDTPSSSFAKQTVTALGTAAQEAYQLESSADSVLITAATEQGHWRALSTLIQLAGSRLMRHAPVSADALEIPGVRVKDWPEFQWRGFMLDPARHFLPKTAILKMLDVAALLKLNIFHFHLTDDQGWRLDVPGWPELARTGSWRTQTVIGHAGKEDREYDGTPHGGYYSTDDLLEIIAYAAQRHITVVPELDLPGHMGAAIRAYPEFAIPGTEVENTTWGVLPAVLRPTERVENFLADVLEYILEVFPSPFIHVGGDEVPTEGWNQDELSRRRAAELGLATPADLHHWFLDSAIGRVRAAGRRAICWDEVLEGPPVSQDTLIAAWRVFGREGKSTMPDQVALEQGYQVISCAHTWTYLDAYPTEDPQEPLMIGGLQRNEDVAAFIPVPPEVDEEAARNLIGVQGQLWSEYIKDSRALEYRAFPRLSILADIGWSSEHSRTQHPVLDRLPEHLSLLEAADINFHPLGSPHPWQQGGTGRLNRER